MHSALWDTGATRSVITPRVIEACGLKPLGSIKPTLVQGGNGVYQSEGYQVNLSLPGKVTFQEIVVSKDLSEGWWRKLPFLRDKQ
ncbi:retropepsin-like aspartic protease [Nitrosovibrio tenuis]|uniref:retropepsin-like aspartic protease n=1 Tax=Nitrosovibrio tenuis TaxID=1233 RepID=UPI000B86B126